MDIKITDMNDLIKHIRGELNKKDSKLLSEIKDESGMDYHTLSRQELREAAEELENYLKDWIQDYYDSYTPSEYFPRTGAFKESVKSTVTTVNGKMQAIVYFEEKGAVRDSFMDNPPQGYLPALLNDGWKVKKPVSFRDTYHMGYYEGFHFIEMAVAEAKKNPKFKNIEIIVNKESPF